MNASRQSLYDRFPNHRENVDVPNKCFNKFVIWSLKQKLHVITAGCINNSSMSLRRNCSSKKVFATV